MNWVIMRMVVDFPAPFGPEEADHLPAIHLEGDLLHGGDAAEALGNPIERK